MCRFLCGAGGTDDEADDLVFGENPKRRLVLVRSFMVRLGFRIVAGAVDVPLLRTEVVVLMAHTTSYREPRFAELDALIAAGFGHVDGRRIERLIRENGGKLPATPPVEMPEPPEPLDECEVPIPQHVTPQRVAVANAKAIALAAIEAGCRTSVEVAEATGLSPISVRPALSILRKLGEIEICGQFKGPSGQTVYAYRRTNGETGSTELGLWPTDADSAARAKRAAAATARTRRLREIERRIKSEMAGRAK